MKNRIWFESAATRHLALLLFLTSIVMGEEVVVFKKSISLDGTIKNFELVNYPFTQTLQLDEHSYTNNGDVLELRKQTANDSVWRVVWRSTSVTGIGFRTNLLWSVDLIAAPKTNGLLLVYSSGKSLRCLLIRDDCEPGALPPTLVKGSKKTLKFTPPTAQDEQLARGINPPAEYTSVLSGVRALELIPSEEGFKISVISKEKKPTSLRYIHTKDEWITDGPIWGKPISPSNSTNASPVNH